MTVTLLPSLRPQLAGAPSSSTTELRCDHPPLPAAGRGVRASDVAFWLGTTQHRDVWIPVERPVMAIGPARSGKGYHLAVPLIIESPGAVITTSTRVDNLVLTSLCRAARGPVYCFNLDGEGGLPHTINWDPLEGCEDPAVARRRAKTLVGATGLGQSDGNSSWAITSANIVEAMLHAGADAGLTIGDVYRWTISPDDCADAIAILLRGAQRSADPLLDEWHRTLEMIRDQEARMKDNRWFGVELAFSPFRLHKIRTLMSHPRTGGKRFNTRNFLQSGGTVYMIARGADSTDETAGASGTLYSLFLDHVTDVAHTMSQEPGAQGRLDPPLTLVLDELANIHPWKAAARIMSAGSGEGIQEVAIFQSWKQAVDAYGPERAGVIWDNSLSILLGNSKDPAFLEDFCKMVAKRRVLEKSVARQGGWFGAAGSVTATTSEREVSGVEPDELRSIPFGTAAVLDVNSPLMVVDLARYQHRRHQNCVAASKAWYLANPGSVLTSEVREVAHG